MELRCYPVLSGVFYLVTFAHLAIGDLAENSTDVQEASVEEVPNPTMTIEKGDLSDYRLPGYYPFNNGEPFFLEKDPLTGAVDFNKKTPITGYAGVPEFTSASKQDRVTGQEKADATESEYYDDDEVSTTDQDFKDEGIDRKDGNVDGYRPNDIEKNPFKISPDLHQFLNLPVHYSTSDKFPLISSSYANTKIQGTGSNSNNTNNNGYSNHKYATTSSTQSPSYYTFKQSTSTTSRPITQPTLPPSPPMMFTTPKPKTTSKPSTSPPKITVTTITTTSTTPKTTTKSSFPEYNEGEELVYSDYEMEYGQPQNSYSHNIPSEPVTTTTKRAPTTVFKPTAISIKDEYVTRKPMTNITETEEEFEEDVSIVTSLPVDVYYFQQTQSTTPKITTFSTETTTPKPVSSTEQVRETSASSTATTEAYSKPTVTLTTTASTPAATKFSTVYSDIYKPTPPSNYHFYNKDNFEPIVDEPFRPIFGPHDSSSQPPISHKPQVHNEVKPTSIPHKPYFEYHSPSNAKPLPNQGKIEFVERAPVAEQANKYSNKPVGPPKYPGVEPPRPNPPLVFANHEFNEHSSEHFVKQPVIPQQSNPPLYNNNDKQNLNGNPIRIPPQHEPVNFGRPQGSIVQGPVIPDLGSPVRQPPQNQRPFIRLPDEVPFYVKKHSNGTVMKIHKPEEIIYPQQRPVGVLPPTGLKPEVKPINQAVKFHPPMKHDNHFIKVPVDEENPSYSLQTSFSIGLPGNGPGDKENEKKTSQGVGQVLFPDGSVDTSLQSDKDKPIQPLPIRNRPQNTRPYITSYNQNNPPQTRPQQPAPVLPQRPPPQRLPGPELRPPKPNSDNYPRPHWENHPKPHIHFNPHHSSGPKQELPPPYTAINKIKPDSNVQRPDLPNILPQFRPNAKVGSNEFATNAGNVERLREPMDILQPPPLPQPQHLRVNRNDDSSISEEIEKNFEESDANQTPLIHRRTGSQPANNRVTTLQMMQQGPPRRNLIRTDYHENRQEKPVYLVYPANANANAGSKQQIQTPSNDGVVVVGTRGPHQPVPPSNLKATITEKEDDSDLFPLDDEKQFSIPTRDRVDTPVLKLKTPNKPALKNEFPYEILKPQENVLPEERIMAGGTATKEYNAFSPTVSSSTEDVKDPDAEINLIPYLQDYMPIATKKPIMSKPGSIITAQILNSERNPELIKLPSTNKPISVTLNTKLVTTVKPDPSSDYNKNSKPVLPLLNSHENLAFGTNNGGKTEYTVGTVMHTNYVKKPVNHRPFDIPPASNQPKPVDLEAPFQASLSAPESQGWTVVKSNSDKRNQDVDRHDSESKNDEDPAEATESKFDFENFKPQLFGGFKPIIPASEEKSDNKSKENAQDKLSERQEKTYR